MPAWRNPEARSKEIKRVLTVLSLHYPEYLSEPVALTAPPTISKALEDKNTSEGYPRYGLDYGLKVWDHLAVDVIPHESEILETIENLGLAS
jgi:hypothetical protein